MKRKSNQFCGGKYANGLALLIVNCALLITLSACGVSKQIAKQAQQTVLADSLLATAHIGISVYDATDGKYLYNYQGNKYFIPASNTKIATCYAVMKYLGDSLVGLRYEKRGDSSIKIWPTGDPTFLHPDFKNQPVYNFLKNYNDYGIIRNFEDEREGKGWSWDDYQDDYMVQRSDFPIYGNVMRISKDGDSIRIKPRNFHYEISTFANLKNGFKVFKPWESNDIFIDDGAAKYLEIPFNTYDYQIWQMLMDTLHHTVYQDIPRDSDTAFPLGLIHSQPTDSLLKIMMHRSDNFYAEQSLLMVGNEHIGVMNDAKIIDTLLSTDYAAMPQRPQWVDGSGLSRYNLFTPQDFVFILSKMRNEFSWNRITTIFSTGGDGTLGSYYKGLKGKIFAKTGSLSNNIALSGYLITQKNKTLIFSVLVNNHTTSSSTVRKAVERFLTAVQRDN